MKNSTDEFSFVLKPTKHGVGVFATHNIKKGTHLRVLGNEGEEISVRRKKVEVPELFGDYCIHRNDKELICPPDFGHMHIGWYINHSSAPTAYHEGLIWYAARDIEVDEEITADYNTLGEPEEAKENYYSG